MLPFEGAAIPFASQLPFRRALSTETKVESETSQSKSGTSVDFIDSGYRSTPNTTGNTFSTGIGWRAAQPDGPFHRFFLKGNALPGYR